MRDQVAFDIGDFCGGCPDESGLHLCGGCGSRYKNGNVSGCMLHGCEGAVKLYDYKFGFLANLLDRVGYRVEKYTVADENAKGQGRFIEIYFSDKYFPHRDYPARLPPQFEFENSGLTDGMGRRKEFVRIGRTYCANMPQVDFAVEISRDRADLIAWIFSLPLVRCLFMDG